MAVEMIPGNNCDFSTYLAKETRAQLEHAQRCSFLIMEQNCGPLAVEIVPGKRFDFSINLAKRTRA
jgi:hypothetical protein